MTRIAFTACLLPLLAACGATMLYVVAEPTDSRILMSSAGKGGTFQPVGKGRASVRMEFKSDDKGDTQPIVVRVSKDGYASQEFEYGPDDDIPSSIVVKLDTVRAVEIRELERTSSGLVVTTRVTLAEVEEVERSPNVKSVTRVTSFKNEDRKFIHTLDVSPDPAAPLIAFDLSETEEVKEIDPETRKDIVRNVTFVNIWLTRAGETGITRLTYGKSGYDTRPAFSRDGQFIYFSSTRSGNPLIWRTRAGSAGGITRITSGNALHFDPHSGPERLLFTEFFSQDRPSLLWASNPDGGLPTQMREGEQARWSADGSKIVYLVPDRNVRKKVKLGQDREVEIPVTKIWVMNSEGSNPTQLTFGDSMDSMPSWSPDGSKITFASDMGKDSKGRKNMDVWMMNSDGTQLTQLTTNGSEDDSPVWDPAGKHIYFRSNRGIGVNIWRMEPAR